MAACAAGAVAAFAAVTAALFPDVAQFIAVGAVVAGVAIGSLLTRRARDEEIISALTDDDEHQADRHWQLRDIAEHYRRAGSDRRRAEAASTAKSQFLATVSHELRTPLSGVLGIADVLAETRLDAEQATFTRAIRTSGELMLGLVDDMLDFAKIEAGRFDLAPIDVAIEDVLEEVTELFFSRAETKGLDLATYVDPDAPTTIHADPGRLRQVLINLIGNALKFTESGGVAVTAARHEGDPGRVRIAIEDTGPGIPADKAERIFEEYEQAIVDPRHRIGGSGLGLAISQRIVQRMGDRIIVTARPGGGSVFSFELPGGVASQAEAASTNGAPSSAKGGRALIVSGEGPAAELMIRQLTEMDAVARLATSATQAAALAGAATAAGESYDFVIVDERITADPAAVLATIREAAGTKMPGAIVIPPGQHAAATAYKEAGFGGYLVRPIRRRSLQRIVDGLASGEMAFRRDPKETRPRRSRLSSAGQPLRVLIAEDDEINTLLIRTMLQRLGHEVRETADGASALRVAAETSFDLMLIDLGLPVLDGCALAHEVRRRESGVSRATLIAVTADARPETRELALAAGFDAFVPKPLTPANLAELFASLTRSENAA